MNLLRSGAEWLQAQLAEHASVTVTYRRGGHAVEVTAVIGSTVREAGDSEGFVVRSETRDYLIATADLVIDGVETLPERGDEIVETVGETEIIYEVLPVHGQELWRYSDPFRRTLRIHTQLRQ